MVDVFKLIDCQIKPSKVRLKQWLFHLVNMTSFPRKECDNESKDFSRQPSNHVHLQEGLRISVNKFGSGSKRVLKEEKKKKSTIHLSLKVI